MFTITAKVPITEQAWGLTFINGVAQTGNEQIAKKLKAKGYDVILQEADVKPAASLFSELKKAELVSYAQSAGVDISGCKTNAAIIEVLEAFIANGGDDTGTE